MDMSYRSYRITSAENIKYFGIFIAIIGILFLFFSIIAYSAFDNYIDTLEFVVTFVSSIPMILLGGFFSKKSETLATYAFNSPIIRYILVIIQFAIIGLIMLMLEFMIGCGGCIIISVLVIVIFIIIILFFVSLYLYCTKQEFLVHSNGEQKKKENTNEKLKKDTNNNNNYEKLQDDENTFVHITNDEEFNEKINSEITRDD